jgi:hypothetical protein
MTIPIFILVIKLIAEVSHEIDALGYQLYCVVNLPVCVGIPRSRNKNWGN